SLLNQGLTSTKSTPKVDWDGVHIFLRYQDEYTLYYASINRRDNKIIIKKKLKGGPNPSNGGTYYDLCAPVSYEVSYGQWQNVMATIKDNPDGSVTIALYANDKLLVSATDNGVGGDPIRKPGKTGIRADNANIKFRDFTVRALTTKVGQVLRIIRIGAKDAI